ncbi:MAG: cytochrome bc complex cytochrome b subunit [Fimbriimonadaceae bacterium]|nr:cytochrome bc complex cytochrome b subunit [Fimbriimonadaceae bacterium]
MTKPNWLRRAWTWSDARLDLTAAADHLKAKQVPNHRHTFWYYWGGVALFLFLVQVVSGILLLVYYRPGPESYDSVRKIMNEVQFGWLMRSIHAWSANLMVGAVFVHMFSVFFMKAYRQPREFGWWSGLALLGLAMVFGFSGYLLPMDELALCATRVGLALPEIVPGVSQIITVVVRGGADISDATVQRFFVLHVVVLPLIFLPLLAGHLFLVQKHGNALPESEEAKPVEARRSVPFFPHFMMRDLAAWLVVFTVLSSLAALFPWKLGPQGDPLAAAPLGIHPEWYFMSQFTALKLIGMVVPGTLGEIVGIGLFGLGGLLWCLVPFFDPRTPSGAQGRKVTQLGIGVVIFLALLTILGYFLA